MEKIYKIKFQHFGNTNIDISKIQTVTLSRIYSDGKVWKRAKPFGGLWLSYDNQWKNWCTDNNYNIESLNTVFNSKLRKDTKILCINSIEDYIKWTDKKGYLLIKKIKRLFDGIYFAYHKNEYVKWISDSSRFDNIKNYNFDKFFNYQKLLILLDVDSLLLFEDIEYPFVK